MKNELFRDIFSAPQATSPHLTDVVLLHLADVTVQRTVSKQNQHGGTGTLLDRRDDMGRVSHHSVLVLSDQGAQQDPGLVLDVEHPQLAGHVSRGVDLSSVHVDLPLDETADRSHISQEVSVVIQTPAQQELNQNLKKKVNWCGYPQTNEPAAIQHFPTYTHQLCYRLTL